MMSTNLKRLKPTFQNQKPPQHNFQDFANAPVEKKFRLKDQITKLKLILKDKRVRLLLKQARLEGQNEGWDKAHKKATEQEERNVAEFEKRIDMLKAEYEQKIDTLKGDHAQEIQNLRTKHSKEIDQQHSDFESKVAAYDNSYKEKCQQNDKLRADAIAEATRLKECAQRAETFWRNQVEEVRVFMTSATSIVQTIADRYEFLQNSLSKIQVGTDMVERLQKSFNKIVSYANKDAPPILGDTAFKK